jgi:hypothetical protein
MEPQVLPALLNYFELGGNIDEAHKLLVDSYQGLSQMSNLFGSWLSLLESTNEDAPQTSKKSSGNKINEVRQEFKLFLFCKSKLF